MRNTLGIAGVALFICMGVTAWAMQSPPAGAPASIKTLQDAEAAIAGLTARLDALEKRLDDADSEGPAAAPAAVAGAPVMKVESFSTVLPDDATKLKIEQLNSEADGFRSQAVNIESAIAASPIDDPRAVTEGARTTARRQQDSMRSQAAEARRKERAKREEAKRLAAPHQVIRGWNGKKTVEVRTDRDLTSALKDMRVGSFITGRGTLLDSDDTSATVLATTLSIVGQPANWVDRPAGSKPPPEKPATP